MDFYITEEINWKKTMQKRILFRKLTEGWEAPSTNNNIITPVRKSYVPSTVGQQKPKHISFSIVYIKTKSIFPIVHVVHNQVRYKGERGGQNHNDHNFIMVFTQDKHKIQLLTGPKSEEYLLAQSLSRS